MCDVGHHDSCSSPMPTALFIDSMGLVFRAYHAMSKSGFKAPNGEPTGAVFGFANMITSLLDREKPDFIAAAFDTSAPTFRHDRYDGYKAHRDEFPEELIPQMPRIKDFLKHIGIPVLELPGFEADDIIGTLAKQAGALGYDVRCLTSDKDYFQLVDDRICILRPGKDANAYDEYRRDQVKEKMGVYPEQIIDLLALIGDASDNIPGVKGIGEKTAQPLIEKYGTVDNLYEAIDEIERETVKRKLIDGKDSAMLSKELVTIHTEVPLPLSLQECIPMQPNPTEIDALFSLLQFNTLRRKWAERTSGQINAIDRSETNPHYANVTNREHDYQLITDELSFKLMMHELKAAKGICFDLETTSLDTMNCSIVGFALSAKPSRAFFIITNDDDIAQSLFGDSLFDIPAESTDTSHPHAGYLNARDVAKALKPLLEDSAIEKIAQHGKFDALILKRYGITVHPLSFDPMLASYVLNPDTPHGMDALSKTWLQYEPIPISALIGEKKQGSMRDVEPMKLMEYAAEDADITLELAHCLQHQLEQSGQLGFAQTVEFPLSEVLVEMEYNGVSIDLQALSSISVHIREEVTKLKEKIYEAAGTDAFNIDSPKQVGEILFDRLALPSPKKTKTGYSTDVSVLSELSEEYPIAGYILEHRQLQKLQSTYVESLPKMVNAKTGRIHTTYNQTIAGTGRLSSTEPNLQNIPIRTALGREIRKAFVPKPGNILLSADYSQIELRVMAHVCSDQTLTHAFINGHDIHAATAAALFGISLEDVDSDKRRIAKTVNFGIMYGQGSFGLAKQLGISRTEAKEIIDQYFLRYPNIKLYIDQTIEKAKKQGYVETLLGRRRYFPSLESNNQAIRQGAERAAINMPIQGTAADMMKLAMINVHGRMKKEQLKSLMILQIHDELVFDAIKDEVDYLRTLVKEEMESAMPLGEIPILVETGIGNNWEEAH
ncbi:MAG: DNA polymerase I [Ignavibacteria bacterium]|nr:DNA polymerase I [Ignavibacteria bacterium]